MHPSAISTSSDIQDTHVDDFQLMTEKLILHGVQIHSTMNRPIYGVCDINVYISKNYFWNWSDEYNLCKTND